jgi:hypothetical protein
MMSLINENPERYDEFIRKGIAHWLDHQMTKAGFVVPGEWYDGYEALVEVLQTDPAMKDFYELCLQRASKQISAAEQEYFSGLIDDAKER